jgi:hypothetical protein
MALRSRRRRLAKQRRIAAIVDSRRVYGLFKEWVNGNVTIIYAKGEATALSRPNAALSRRGEAL